MTDSMIQQPSEASPSPLPVVMAPSPTPSLEQEEEAFNSPVSAEETKTPTPPAISPVAPIDESDANNNLEEAELPKTGPEPEPEEEAQAEEAENLEPETASKLTNGLASHEVSASSHNSPSSPSSPSISNSSCPPSPHLTMTAPSPTSSSNLHCAIDELRRENERILAELANTQQVLDLFESYRALLQEQMGMCICSGKSYTSGRWKQLEADYETCMPIRRIIEPHQLIRASGAEQFSDRVVSIVDGTEIHHRLASTMNGELRKYKIGPGYENSSGRATVLAKSWVPTNDVTWHAVSPTSGAGKSKVRSYLDSLEMLQEASSGPSILQSTLQPLSSGTAIKMNGTAPKVQSIVASVPMSTLRNQQARVNQIVVRKRMVGELTNEEDEREEGATGSPIKNGPNPGPAGQSAGIVVKKSKLTTGSSLVGSASLLPGQKYTILTTTSNKTGAFAFTNAQGQKVILSPKPQVQIRPQQQQPQPQQQAKMELSPDHEEERLDRINNALDQILLGRYDALNALGGPPRSGLTMKTVQLGGGNRRRMVQEEEGEGDDEEDDDEEDDEDIIFLDEVKSNVPAALGGGGGGGKRQTMTATPIAVALKPKIVLASDGKRAASASSGPSILGAALESGFKPYPATYQISKQSNGTGNHSKANGPAMNHATIKLFQPTTSQTAAGTTTTTPIAVQFNASSSSASSNAAGGGGGVGGNGAGGGSNVTLISGNSAKALFTKRPHLTAEERLDIISRLKKNESGARIARDYGITKQAVSAIKRRAQLMGDSFSINIQPYVHGQTPGNRGGGGDANQASSANSITTSMKASPISMHLSSSASGSSSPIDNSLVSRQLKQQQQKAAANSVALSRQATVLANAQQRSAASAGHSGSSSSLYRAVNPVAILKSQMQGKGGNRSNGGSPSRGSLTVTASSASSPSAKLKHDAKRLLLPRLLQGTETYQTYASSSVSAKRSPQAEEVSARRGATPKVPASLGGKPSSFAAMQAEISLHDDSQDEEEEVEDQEAGGGVYLGEVDDGEDDVELLDDGGHFYANELLDFGHLHGMEEELEEEEEEEEDEESHGGLRSHHGDLSFFAAEDETLDPMLGSEEDPLVEAGGGADLNVDLDQSYEDLLMSD